MSTIKKYNGSNFSGLSVTHDAGYIFSSHGAIVMTKPNDSFYDLGFLTTRQFAGVAGHVVYIQTKCDFLGQSNSYFNHMGFIEGTELTGYGDGGIHTSYSLGRYGENYHEARNWFSLDPNGVYTYRQLTPNVFPINVPNQWTDQRYTIEEDGKLNIAIRPSPPGTIGKIDPSVGPAFTNLPDGTFGYKIGGTVGWNAGILESNASSTMAAIRL